MSVLTGTGKLMRLALRLDRVRLPAWVLIIAVLPASTAAQYTKLYPTTQSLQDVGRIIANPSLVAVNGPLFRVSLGGLTAWKIGATEFILAALMSIFTVVRHTRTEEETGRLELIGATAIGRHAPLSAALLTSALANAAIIALVAFGLIGVGLPAGGAVAMGLAIGLAGLMFAALAAVAAQLTAAPGRPTESQPQHWVGRTCCVPSATTDRPGCPGVPDRLGYADAPVRRAGVVARRARGGRHRGAHGHGIHPGRAP